MPERYLSPDAARAFYDRFGGKQDAQGFYEDPALEVMIAQGGFGQARTVVEFGCGTGRLAERLLARDLPGTARYAGTDISATMIGLARRRLARFGDRVRLWQCGAEPDLSPAGLPVDRVVTTYVLDLLPPAMVARFLDAAAAALEPGGLLCVVSLGHGRGPASRLTAWLWGRVARLRPQLVGGCRPIRLTDHLDGAVWQTRFAGQLAPWTIPSEIVIAARR